jgi:hypothetical protein
VTLREQVRLKLIGQGTDPWRDDVIELEGARTSSDLASPIATGQAASLPFVIVRLGPQTPGATWGNLGDSIDVWPYADDETWQTLDQLCGLVLLRLDNQILRDDDGTAYQLGYAGVSTQDTPVAEWDAYTRPLRFDSVKISWLAPTHPLADALQAWTAAHFPSAQTDPDTWLPTDTQPGIYWRVTDVPRVQSNDDHLNIWLDLMRSTVVGHIITPDQRTLVQYLDRLAAILPRASIHYADTYLSRISVSRADPEADPHSEGQISLDVAYGAVNGNYWASVPGDPNHPWVPIDPEHPWIEHPVPPDPAISIPLEHVEVRDGTLVGESPEPTP